MRTWRGIFVGMLGRSINYTAGMALLALHGMYYASHITRWVELLMLDLHTVSLALNDVLLLFAHYTLRVRSHCCGRIRTHYLRRQEELLRHAVVCLHACGSTCVCVVFMEHIALPSFFYVEWSTLRCLLSTLARLRRAYLTLPAA